MEWIQFWTSLAQVVVALAVLTVPVSIFVSVITTFAESAKEAIRRRSFPNLRRSGTD